MIQLKDLRPCACSIPPFLGLHPIAIESFDVAEMNPNCRLAGYTEYGTRHDGKAVAHGLLDAAGYVLHVWILCPSHCDRQGTPGEPAGPPQRPRRHQCIQLCYQVHSLKLD